MEDLGAVDGGIEADVRVLRAGGIETFESCEGAERHPFPEPTVRFFGERHEGWRALALARAHGLRVDALRRTWPLVDEEPTGPYWEITLTCPQR